MKVVWFKRDLRLHDHEALHEALSTSGKTLLLYIFEPSLMKDYHYSQRHFDFIKQSLEALQKERTPFGGETLNFFLNLCGFSRIVKRSALDTAQWCRWVCKSGGPVPQQFCW